MTAPRRVAARRRRAAPTMGVLLVALGGCSGGDDDARSAPVAGPTPPASATSGGATTVFDDTTLAFTRSAATLDGDSRRTFAVGNALFNTNWIVAPGSAEGRDGLGPVHNALSCSGCHFHDGRAAPPAARSGTPGLLIRLSVPGTGPHGEPRPDPNYGGQFNDLAIPGVPAEGSFTITRTEVAGRFDDGTEYTLEQPAYRIDGAFGPLAAGAMLSPRVAPAIVGMGLLEAVPASTVLANADPDDADGDGISGRANMVWSVQAQATVLGRFGWKANQPTVREQVASAFQGDIGLTSSLSPEQPCAPVQVECVAAPTGGEPELDDGKLDRVEFYSRTIAVPARREVGDPNVIAGAASFGGLGCSSCHLTTLTTGPTDIPVLSGQEIHPYTDLLLHDMGPGLADDRPDFLATGSEWRTPPLWGLGLVERVNGHTRFLHDGRARSIEEAILWHGGEAAASMRGYLALTTEERASLIAFLRSL